MGNLGLDWIGNLAEVTKWFKYLGSYSDLSDFKSLLFYPLIWAASCPQRVFNSIEMDLEKKMYSLPFDEFKWIILKTS